MRAIASLFVAMLFLGCGSGTQQTAPEDEDVDFSPEDDPIFGDVPSGDIEEEPTEQSATEEPVAVGPADVTVEVKLGVEDTDHAQVTVTNEAGSTVAQGRAGETFTLQPGTYVISAEVTDTDQIVTAPASGSETVTVEPQEPQTVQVTIPAAHVRLIVKRNGRTLRNPLVTLFHEGGDEQVAQFRAGSQHITISPGRYEADVRTGNQEIHVRGLMFMGGARQNIPVNIQ